jgi:hypothetical protein
MPPAASAPVVDVDEHLEVVAAGHAVWLGDPKRISGLLCEFLRSDRER